MNKIELVCRNCGKIFLKDYKDYNRALKQGRNYFYCSRQCSAIYRMIDKNKTVKDFSFNEVIIDGVTVIKKNVLKTPQAEVQEIIKPFPLQPEYLVSNKGYVLSKKNNTKKLSPSINPCGYKIVQLMDNNSNQYGISLHKMVAITFLGFPMTPNMQVNHINGDKLNNEITNLEWVTPLENAQHAVRELGRRVGGENCNAKSIVATNIQNKNIKMNFPSLSDAARYCQQLVNYKRDFNTTKIIIWRAVNHYNGRHSAYGYYWEYL